MFKPIGKLMLAATLAVAVIPASRASVVSVPVSEGFIFAGIAPKGNFTDQFSFSLLSDSVVDGYFLKGFINNVNLSFKSVAQSAWTPVNVTSNAINTTFTLSPSVLNSGNYLFRIQANGLGNIGALRAYTGGLVVAPVPEPETWAMLMVGSFLVAYQLRRKQKATSQQPLAA